MESVVHAIESLTVVVERVAIALERFNDAAINKDDCLFIMTDEVGH
jgi:hypothetical protein